ncbi:hypothetical protein K438DRAFT_2120539 [Mycena galopus ATCC 62051]|nr:hypothetical protein K438DRAFT_2120539 [Mycena galopus ATCC 62051]
MRKEGNLDGEVRARKERGSEQLHGPDPSREFGPTGETGKDEDEGRGEKARKSSETASFRFRGVPRRVLFVTGIGQSAEARDTSSGARKAQARRLCTLVGHRYSALYYVLLQAERSARGASRHGMRGERAAAARCNAGEREHGDGGPR